MYLSALEMKEQRNTRYGFTMIDDSLSVGINIGTDKIIPLI